MKVKFRTRQGCWVEITCVGDEEHITLWTELELEKPSHVMELP